MANNLFGRLMYEVASYGSLDVTAFLVRWDIKSNQYYKLGNREMSFTLYIMNI